MLDRGKFSANGGCGGYAKPAANIKHGATEEISRLGCPETWPDGREDGKPSRSGTVLLRLRHRRRLDGDEH